MCAVELWLGSAGGGKTQRALTVLRDELNRNWRSIRYLVPTVGHKRSIEHHFLEHYSRQGLFGDPVNIFFTFAQEVAQRGGVHGSHLTELQKHILLKEIVRSSDLNYFARARQYPGFVQALGEAIDELKVHMVQSNDLLRASHLAEENGATVFAQKIFELGSLYARYQQQLVAAELFDNEGIMWLAAECLREQPGLCADLSCLILDGFARLTPIQIHFLRALAPRIPRTILLFDYEEGRSQTYHPVQSSLDRLFELEEHGDLQTRRHFFLRQAKEQTALENLRAEVFRDRHIHCNCDDSLSLFVGATPVHEAELIAREIRSLLRVGKLADGTPVTSTDIAIIARNAERLRERYVRTFKRFGLTIQHDPILLAHTPVGRALLAAFRLVRDRWKREDVLTLLKSGFLPIKSTVAFNIDLIARTHYLRDRRSTWIENWPDDETREELATALTPLLAFDDAYQQHHDAKTIMEAVKTLVHAFMDNALPPTPPLPDIDCEGSNRYIALRSAFVHLTKILDDLQNVERLLGHFAPDDMLEVIVTSLMRERVPEPTLPAEGIPMLAVHATGGEKYKVVFLCNLLEGDFPRHQRESAFLMDHEREETLRDLNIYIETRKHLEHDEQYWFIHALSAASHRVVLSYAKNAVDGGLLERSSFIDEVLRCCPSLHEPPYFHETHFGDVVPKLSAAESQEEFVTGLAFGLRTVREQQHQTDLAAAYAGFPFAHGPSAKLARLFQQAQQHDPALNDTSILRHLQSTGRLYSASELQSYLDCPFAWFGSHCLRVSPVVEEFSPLDRGVILHSVLEQLYRRHQTKPGIPVHLEGLSLDDLWPEVEHDLRELLEQEPRFHNRAQFLQDIEWETLRRMMRRFLRNEITRAETRRSHPAFFERQFGDGRNLSLQLGDGAVRLRGTLDRIDICDDDPRQAIVIDYKSSSSLTFTEIAGGKVSQAPIYLLAAQRIFNFTPLGVEFIRIKQGDTNGVYRSGIQEVYGDASSGKKALGEEQWDEFLSNCETNLCQAAERMGTGMIGLEATTQRCSTRCEYFTLCRGDR
ncbi:MAG TPA: PD-(D/E)XK nuclease family protein, partial [Armatimonadota bacterium]|nr:PD-(D/E)XK nuclease family protein [Armatimonadota bacterium]